jgi:hypothetical protein
MGTAVDATGQRYLSERRSALQETQGQYREIAEFVARSGEKQK